MFISRALSPALVTSVKLKKVPSYADKGKAIVTIPSDQKSKAIGKAGLNIRLASMLTKYDIELIEIASANSTSSNNEKTVINEEKQQTLHL